MSWASRRFVLLSLGIDRKLRRALTPYLLIAPACLLLGIFLYGVVTGVLLGFGIMPFLGINEFTLDYFAQAFANPALVASIGYSLYLAAASAIIATIGGVVLSAAFCSMRAGRMLHLAGIQIPLMTAHALVAVVVVSLFAGSGLLPRLLYHLGLLQSTGEFPSALGDPSGWGIIFVYSWKEIPFIAFCTITLMAHVSGSFGEAAASLGASPLRTFFSVTLPLCRGAVIKAFLIVFAFAFGSYELPFLLGPTTPKALPVLAYFEFQNPDLINRGYAMAIDGIMTGICALLALAYFIVLQRERKAARQP
ncbi:MAG: ABC transporter permease subunit [Coriobacteriales bacterium]|jgi:putative spermidine/putrescine transport system permease protein|nr:ABC transporter permease subunit [Coriobacteriales bacterium]